MNKFRYFLMFIVFMTIVPYGCAGEVDEAKDFIKAGMYPPAIDLLKKRIEKTPTDTEAQFQLGICYIYTNDFSNARDRFSSAVKLKSDYGFKIGSEYKKVGDEALAKNNFTGAQQAYSQAIQYQPDLKSIIINDLKEGGIKNLNKHTIERADEHFAYLYSLDKGSGSAIAEVYLGAFKQGGDDEYLAALVEQAINYDQGQETQRAYSEYYFGLSKKAETTEKALVYLENANRHGHLYETELLAKKEQLKEEELLETVKKYEAQFGQAKIARISEDDKWIEICDIDKGARFQYLSSSSFMIKVEKKSRELRLAMDKPNWIEFYSNDMEGNDSPVWLSKKNQNSCIYYWIIQKS